MVTGIYRDFFVAIAGTAGSLTGLLFVALSVSARPRGAGDPDVIRQVRAAAALLAFTNALAVSLFGLVPNNYIGYPAAVLGIIGVLFALGGVRSMLADPVARSQMPRQVGLMAALLAAFGVEIVCGVLSIRHPHATAPVDIIGNVLAASVLIGVARSWELVGDRDYGIVSSLAALAGHERHLGGAVVSPADVPPAGRAGPGDGAAPADGAAPGHAAGSDPAAGPGALGGQAGRSTPGD